MNKRNPFLYSIAKGSMCLIFIGVTGSLVYSIVINKMYWIFGLIAVVGLYTWSAYYLMKYSK